MKPEIAEAIGSDSTDVITECQWLQTVHGSPKKGNPQPSLMGWGCLFKGLAI
jgi:hypothetical protein